MKNLYIILSIIAIISLGIYFAFDDQKSVVDVQVERPTGSFFSDILHLGFEYPSGSNGYILEDLKNNDTNPNFVRAMYLMKAEDKENIEKIPTGGEWPPIITMYVLKNLKGQSVSDWTKENTNYSNFNLKKGEVSELTVGGNSAIRYIADGLYMSDTAVVSGGENIYVFIGMYDDTESVIRIDFSDLINTITFSTEISAEQ